jgi:peptidyl-prolyl cis-trans isomerase C
MRARHLAAVLLAAVVASCSKGPKKDGPLVAKGDGVAVTAEEFKRKLDEQSPFIRARYATLDRKKEFLENLVRFQLLAAEARAQGLEKDPEVQDAIEKILVQRLVRKSFDEGGASAASEADARKYYEDHRDEFVKPERVRVSQIFLRAEKGSTERAARAAEAKKVLARLKAEEAKNPLLFSNLARDLSDDPQAKASGGDLGYRSREELEGLASRPVADAAFGLRAIGDETGVVEADRGFYILKLTARQPAVNRSFDEVKGQLVARASRDSRSKDFDAFVKKLREKAGVKIDDAELEKVPVAAAGPAAPAAAAGAQP